MQIHSTNSNEAVCDFALTHFLMKSIIHSVFLLQKRVLRKTSPSEHDLSAHITHSYEYCLTFVEKANDSV